MAKRRITPERREQRKKLLEMLQDAGINDVAGVIYRLIHTYQACST
jgi:putative transposase